MMWYQEIIVAKLAGCAAAGATATLALQQGRMLQVQAWLQQFWQAMGVI
jgi:hypothetical protein